MIKVFIANTFSVKGKNVVNPVHVHNDRWQLRYMPKGQMYYRLDSGQEMIANPNECMLLAPGIYHMLTNKGENYTVYNIKYRFSEQKKYFPEIPIIVKLGNLCYSFEELLSSIIYEARMNLPFKEKILDLRIKEALYILQRADEQNKMKLSAPEKHNPIVEKSILFIDNNFDCNLSVDDVVANSNCSRTKLYVDFKKNTGYSIYDYIIHLRIEKAKSLLKEQELNIKEIASIVGYDDEFHFSRIFKKNQGCSPSAYQNSHVGS